VVRLPAPIRPAAAGPRLLVAAPSPVPTRSAPSDIGAPPPAPTHDAMAPPDGAAVSDDAMVLTQRKLLMEMREDIKGLKTTVDVIAKDQALGVEGGMTQRGDVGGIERKTGRGERNSAVMSDADAVARLVRESSAREHTHLA
jgi:hypothetical protein